MKIILKSEDVEVTIAVSQKIKVVKEDEDPEEDILKFAYNHNREDSWMNPCDKCLPTTLQGWKQLAQYRGDAVNELSEANKKLVYCLKKYADPQNWKIEGKKRTIWNWQDEPGFKQADDLLDELGYY